MRNLNSRAIALGLLFAFFLNTTTLPGSVAVAQDFVLPAPGQMVALSPADSPVVLKGIQLDPKDPFKFHFFVDTGDHHNLLLAGRAREGELKQESSKLIKYFLASLTIPEEDLWVNLSPYEKNRIVPDAFGQTAMGRDLLAEDYMLKQITASLIYPEDKIGKEFWQKVYAQAQAQYGTTNIPINTFNKVWIVPDKAVVYENNGTAFVLENHLKVMLEEDYLSLSKHHGRLPTSQALNMKAPRGNNLTHNIASQIIRQLVLPQLEKEVNEGKNFAQLRQVFYSLILATWYKKKIKDSILNKVYANQKKIQNLSSSKASLEDPQYIYQQYLKAFKKGVFNYIKDEPSLQGQTTPRKYFSGGVEAGKIILALNTVGLRNADHAGLLALMKSHLIDADVAIGFDRAQSARRTGAAGLSDNYAINNLLGRSITAQETHQKYQMILNSTSPVFNSIVRKYDRFSDAQIMAAADRIFLEKKLHLNEPWTMREIFLHPSVGSQDIQQAIGGMMMTFDISSMDQKLEHDPAFAGSIDHFYLILKALEVLSRNPSLFLPQDLNANGSLYRYLVTDQYVTGSPKAMNNFFGLSTLLINQLWDKDMTGKEAAVNITRLAGKMKRPEKQANVESIRNYLALLDLLMSTPSSPWKAEFDRIPSETAWIINRLNIGKLRGAIREIDHNKAMKAFSDDFNGAARARLMAEQWESLRPYMRELKTYTQHLDPARSHRVLNLFIQKFETFALGMALAGEQGGLTYEQYISLKDTLESFIRRVDVFSDLNRRTELEHEGQKLHGNLIPNGVSKDMVMEWRAARDGLFTEGLATVAGHLKQALDNQNLRFELFQGLAQMGKNLDFEPEQTICFIIPHYRPEGLPVQFEEEVKKLEGEAEFPQGVIEEERVGVKATFFIMPAPRAQEFLTLINQFGFGFEFHPMQMKEATLSRGEGKPVLYTGPIELHVKTIDQRIKTFRIYKQRGEYFVHNPDFIRPFEFNMDFGIGQTSAPLAPIEVIRHGDWILFRNNSAFSPISISYPTIADRAQVSQPSGRAMTPPLPSSLQKGGIDLNPSRMDLQTKLGTGSGFALRPLSRGQNAVPVPNFDIDPAQITGVTFTIRSMKPVENISFILGLK